MISSLCRKSPRAAPLRNLSSRHRAAGRREAERLAASLTRQSTKSARLVIISRIVMSSIIIIMVYIWINEDTLLYVYLLVQ